MTSRKPTILHVIDTTGPGGAETVFLNLAEAVSIEGYATLAMIRGQGWVQTQLEKRKIPFVVLSPFGFLSLPYYWAVFKLMKYHNVKFVQAHLLGSALTFAILNLLTRTPVVATLHGKVDVNPNEGFILVKRWLLKKGLNKVVAVSGQLAEYLAERQLFSRAQIVVIHNGIDVDKYQMPDSGRLKREMNLPENAKLVGSIGNIRPAKDYQNLIRAASLVVAKNANVHFLIAGHSKEPLQSELDDLSKQLGIKEHIHFLGFLDDTPEFLAQIDIFVLSSKSEGFSISTLEAMAAKTPIVVTRCGGPEEIIRPGVDGLVVSISSPPELAVGIERLFEEDSVTLYVSNGFHHVKADFGGSSMVQKYVRMAYEQLR